MYQIFAYLCNRAARETAGSADSNLGNPMKYAEYGIAAHWRYKEKGSRKADSASDIKF